MRVSSVATAAIRAIRAIRGSAPCSLPFGAETTRTQESLGRSCLHPVFILASSWLHPGFILPGKTARKQGKNSMVDARRKNPGSEPAE
jgi:hypothetical protein